jgi:hypothetical protein
MITREFEPSPRVAEYRRVLRKHRWLMTGIFLLTVLTVAIWTFVQVTIYQAVADPDRPEPPRVLNIQDVTPVGAMSAGPRVLPTQYGVRPGGRRRALAAESQSARPTGARRRAGASRALGGPRAERGWS